MLHFHRRNSCSPVPEIDLVPAVPPRPGPVDPGCILVRSEIGRRLIQKDHGRRMEKRAWALASTASTPAVRRPGRPEFVISSLFLFASPLRSASMSQTQFDKAVAIVQGFPKDGPIKPSQADQLTVRSRSRTRPSSWLTRIIFAVLPVLQARLASLQLGTPIERSE